MRIKAIYPHNLKMSEQKVASQIAHAVKNLGETPSDCIIVVLKVSQTKFRNLILDAIDNGYKPYVQKDLGLTEVTAGTETAAAWIENGI